MYAFFFLNENINSLLNAFEKLEEKSKVYKAQSKSDNSLNALFIFDFNSILKTKFKVFQIYFQQQK